MIRQITYIGVPLTVLGVLPILYNVSKALYIRYQLSKSIPWQLRPCYTFITDPAAGTVTVVTQTPLFCTNPGLWPNEPSIRLDVRDRFKQWRHRIFYGLLAKSTKWASLVLSACIPHRGTRANELDAMELANFHEQTPANVEPSNARKEPTQQSTKTRFSMDMNEFVINEQDHLLCSWMPTVARNGCITKDGKDFNRDLVKTTAIRMTVNIDMDIPKSPVLVMKWKDFVWFSLAIGVDPADLHMGGTRINLKSRSDSPSVLMHGSRADADDDWYFALRANQQYQLSVPRALAWWNIMCIERRGSVLARRVGSSSETKFSREIFDSPGKFAPSEEQELYPDGNTTSAALTWILHRDHWSGRLLENYDDPAFTPPWICGARETSMFFLYGLDCDGTLHTMLSELFQDGPQRAQIPLLSPSGQPNAIPTATSVKGLADIPTKILFLLRDSFRWSEYLGDAKRIQIASHRFAEMLRNEERENWDQEKINWWSAIQGSKCFDNEHFSTYKIGPPRREDRPIYEQLLLEVASRPQFSELERSYNPHRNEHIVETKTLTTGKLEFMANLYVALQPFSRPERTRWKLKDCIKSKLTGLRYADLSERNTRLEFAATLERLVEDTKKGIYSLIWKSQVSHLFEEGIQEVPEVVYLV